MPKTPDMPAGESDIITATAVAAILSVRVVGRRDEAREVCSLELADLHGAPLPPFEAGAHIDVHLPGGLTRQYSLCGQPDSQHYLIGVLRSPTSRGGSIKVHDGVKLGDVLRIGVPKNHFRLAPSAHHSVLIAGGIGITPILTMAETLLQRCTSFELHYAARSADRLAFRSRILGSGLRDHTTFHLDDAPAQQQLDAPTILRESPRDAHVYVCGPQGLIDLVRREAAAIGYSDAQVHFEFFTVDTASATSCPSGGAFRVQLARSGRVLPVPPGVSIVNVLATAGVDVPTSCELGVCGTCMTRVLQGVPDHRDLYLTPAERARNDCFTPCVSRALSELLVLDL
jgi:vanillate monooxygenase ferredoxin subunit